MWIGGHRGESPNNFTMLESIKKRCEKQHKDNEYLELYNKNFNDIYNDRKKMGDAGFGQEDADLMIKIKYGLDKYVTNEDAYQKINKIKNVNFNNESMQQNYASGNSEQKKQSSAKQTVHVVYRKPKQQKQEQPKQEKTKAVNANAANSIPVQPQSSHVVQPVAPQVNDKVGFNINNFIETPEQAAKKQAERNMNVNDLININTPINMQPVNAQPVMMPTMQQTIPVQQPQVNPMMNFQPQQPTQPIERQAVSRHNHNHSHNADKRTVREKFDEILKYYSFIEGTHTGENAFTNDDADCLLTIIKDGFIQRYLQKHKIKASINTNKLHLTEIPLDDNEAKDYKLAFRLLTDDAKNPLKVLIKPSVGNGDYAIININWMYKKSKKNRKN